MQRFFERIRGRGAFLQSRGVSPRSGPARPGSLIPPGYQPITRFDFAASIRYHSRMPHEEIVPILDFGAQYAQLIARRVREKGVYSELVRPDIPAEELKKLNPKGIILSGGPASVYEKDAPRCDPAIFDLGVPILGICYGMQLGAQILGGAVKPAKAREFGRARLKLAPGEVDPLLRGLPEETTVWMSHGDQVHELPDGFVALAATPTCPLAAARHRTRPFYGVQFHPEVTHTPRGELIFQNFLYDICKCSGTWTMGGFVEQASRRIREQVGSGRVICGLSGGVDSSVTAALLHKAVGDQLTCIFVDNGLLRKNEVELVDTTFRNHFHIDLRLHDASKQFLSALGGVSDPQTKRKTIGHEFIEAFKRAAADIPDVRFLAQGTLYPDVIEAGMDLPARRPTSNCTTTSAGCLRNWDSNSSSRCGSYSRTRCAKSGGCSVCPTRSSGGIRSPAPALPCGSSGR